MGIREALKRPGGTTLAITTILVILTAVAMLWPVSNGTGTHCGSWLLQDDGQARLADINQREADNLENFRNGMRSTMGLDDGPVIRVNRANTAARCANERGEMTPIVATLAIASGIALVVGLIRRYQPAGGTRRSPDTPS